MPIVKAAAYGTQERMLARFLEECGIDILGVAHVDEGISLKKSGARQSIFCLHAAPYETEKVAHWGLEVGVSTHSCIERISASARNRHTKVKVHLHVDTGMARFGCRPEDSLALARQIADDPYLHLEGIMTHFVAADDPSHDAFTQEQADKLSKAIQEIEAAGISIPWRHASNSSAAQRLNFQHFNMARIGLAMYGLVRTAETPISHQLRLALSLTTKLTGVNTTKAGETVGYGRRWESEVDSRIGIIPIGYYDGLHRQYSNRAQVMIRGKKVPLVGTICMDYCMCDLSNVPEAQVGDTVLIFGEDDAGHYQAPADLASSGGTIVHELITCLGPRVHRIFIDEEKP
jgi:alanine racemase